MIPTYHELEHRADMSLRVFGDDLRALFANAARAMFEQLADLSMANPSTRRDIDVGGIDLESLLVNWLNELLYLHEVQREVYSRFVVTELTIRHMRAAVYGQPVTQAHLLIKAATFHGLHIEKDCQGYGTTIVFDV